MNRAQNEAPAGNLAAARFAANLGWQELPAAVQARAILAFRDTLGVMIAGRHTRSAAIAARVASSQMKGDDARIFSTGETASIAGAAFANSVAASALDLDDGHSLGGGVHPGAAIVPTLLAAARGDELLSSVLVAQIAAYEVAIRVGYLLWPRSPTDRRHTAGTALALGAAVASLRLLSADEEAFQRALKIAWCHAPMAALQFPMAKEALGWAGATGVIAAQLANEGFAEGSSGPSQMEDEVWPQTPFDDATPGDSFAGAWGDRYEILNTYFKRYSCCRYTHAALDILAELKGQHGVVTSKIEGLTVQTHRRASWLSEPEPRSLEGAQYSIPYTCALMLVDGDCGPLGVSEHNLLRSDLVELARKVHVVHDAALDPGFPHMYPTSVRIEMRSGEVIEGKKDRPRGDPLEPFTDTELEMKFTKLTAPLIGSAGTRRLLELTSDPTSSIGDVCACL